MFGEEEDVQRLDKKMKRMTQREREGWKRGIVW